MSKRKGIFVGLEKDELDSFVGQTVKKSSGKPFSNGEKLAIISGVLENPHSGHPAFCFEDALLCDAFMCVLAERAEKP